MYTTVKEGTPARYIQSKPENGHIYVITVGHRPLLASGPYAHRTDPDVKGLFSCDFSPEWKTAVSADMLWIFEGAEDCFRLKSLARDIYLNAHGRYEYGEHHRREIVSVEYGDATEFHLTNEGWIAFNDSDTEFKLIFMSSHGFIAPANNWVSSITESADAEFYAVTPAEEAYEAVTYLAPNEDGRSRLSFISDVHNLPKRLDRWLKNLPVTLERCVFGGDITAGNVKSIASQQAAHASVGEIVAKYTSAPPIVTVGNHEREYEYRWEGRSVSDVYPDTVDFGGFTEDNYAVYNYGASEFDHNDFQSHFPAERTEELAKWLAGVPADIPVFVNSHYPLHALKTRPHPDGARGLIDLLNGYPNVIFLWGHNHGQHLETGYGRILTRGDELLYDYETGARAVIGFTYSSHGAMYDAARTVAPYYGLVATVERGRVILTYYDMSGTPLPYKIANGIADKTEFVLEI